LNALHAPQQISIAKLNRASPRLRQSLTASGFGYGLNEEQKPKSQ
jgi:hypothetical protein